MIYDFTPAYLKPPLQICVPPPSQSHVPKCDRGHGENGEVCQKTNKQKQNKHTQFNNNKCCSYPKMCINISINKKTMLQNFFFFFSWIDENMK